MKIIRLRQAKRYREIVSILIRHGFRWLMADLGLKNFRLFGLPRRRQSDAGPELLRKTFEELGVTFIKLAQILSTRPDIISPGYAFELSKLQDRVPALPFKKIRPVLEAELGATVSETFREFDSTPLASASIGQVYRAKLHNGKNVVVKVQKPEVAEAIDRDLEVLEDAVQRIKTHSDWNEKYDLEGLLDEFSFYLRNELNYVREGKNADKFRSMFQKNPGILIPKVHWKYTTAKVLVMDEVQGVKVTDLETCADCDKWDRKKLAITAVSAIFDEIFQYGFFHADPHAGNFVIVNGKVVGLMDFGLVDYLEERERESFLRFIYFLIKGESDEMVEALTDLGIRLGDMSSRHALKRDLGYLPFRFRERTLEEMAADNMFNEMMSIAYRRQLIIPSHLAMLFKVMAMTEGLGSMLYPQFKFFEVAEPLLEKQYERAFSLGKIIDKSQKEFYEFFQLDLPWRVIRLFKRMETGQIEVRVRHGTLSEETEKISKIIRGLSTSIILTVYLLGFGIYLIAGNFLGFGSISINILLSLLVINGLYTAFGLVGIRRQ